MNKLGLAIISLGMLTGCGAEMTVEKPQAEKPNAVSEKVVKEIKVKEEKVKEPTAEEAFAEEFGFTEKETDAIKMVLSAGPYDYKLKDVAEIVVRNEDADFVNYKVTLHDGTVLLPSIRKTLLD